MITGVKYLSTGKTLRCLAHGKLSVNISYQLLDYKLFEGTASFVHMNEQISEVTYLLDGSTKLSEGFSCQEQNSYQLV